MHACLAQEALHRPLVLAVQVGDAGQLMRPADDAIVGVGAAIRAGDAARSLLAHGLSAGTSDRRVSLA